MRLSPLLAPPLTPFAREQAARALATARIGYRMARQYAARGWDGDTGRAAWCADHANYLRATAAAIRAGALHDTAAHGWPYLLPRPALPPAPDGHRPFLP